MNLQSAFLISPWVKLVSTLPSRKANELFDYIETDSSATAVLDYIGAPHPDKKVYSPTWNPRVFFTPPTPAPHAKMLAVVKGKPTVAGKEGKGLDLLRSPYVNPSVCDDLEWWKEAMPGAGKTMVAWGKYQITLSPLVN